MKKFKRILINIMIKIMYLAWLAAGIILLVIVAITYNMIPMLFSLALLFASVIVLFHALTGLFYEDADSLDEYICFIFGKDKPEDEQPEPFIEKINLEHNYSSDFTELNRMIEEKRHKK